MKFAMIAICSLLLVGCQQQSEPVSLEQGMMDTAVAEEKIIQAETELQAVDTAITETDQALDELEQINFGEAPELE